MVSARWRESFWPEGENYPERGGQGKKEASRRKKGLGLNLTILP